MQSPAPGEEQPQVLGQAEGWTAGKQLHRKGPADPGEQAECETAMRTHVKKRPAAS